MKRVIIVDDSAAFLSSLWAMLADKYDVVLAYSGSEYVRIKEVGGCFDHVFMDVRMPGGVNGFEAIQAVPPCSTEKITIMSAGNVDQIQSDVLETREKGYNMTHILIKPFYYHELRRVIGG